MSTDINTPSVSRLQIHKAWAAKIWSCVQYCKVQHRDRMAHITLRKVL